MSARVDLTDSLVYLFINLFSALELLLHLYKFVGRLFDGAAERLFVNWADGLRANRLIGTEVHSSKLSLQLEDPSVIIPAFLARGLQNLIGCHILMADAVHI